MHKNIDPLKLAQAKQAHKELLDLLQVMANFAREQFTSSEDPATRLAAVSAFTQSQGVLLALSMEKF